MHGSVFFNGQILDAYDAAIRAASYGALYGKGIFTTLAVFDEEPFLWEKHWRRLVGNAAGIGIDLSEHSEGTTEKALDEILPKNSVTNGRARLTLFNESPTPLWPVETDRKTSLLIMTSDLRAVPESLRLAVSPHTVNSLSPLAGIKSCNYLDKLLALDEAKKRGSDEAIMLNERGEVTSAVMANVFWLKDGVLSTPGLKTGCLPGTTREFVLENIDCKEVEAPLDELRSADAIFLTSAGLGVIQVAEFETTSFEKQDHPILNILPNTR